MNTRSGRFLVKATAWWEANFIRHPWLVVLSFVLASGLTLRYAVENLKVDTNTADMISTQVPFQQNRLKFESAFPHDVGTITLLVEGPTPESTAAAVKKIGALARAETSEFKSVYIPDESPFFARNGLLYLSDSELQDLINKLAQAQPFIGRVAEDNTLRGLFGILTDALTESGKDDFELELDPLLRKVTEAVEAATAGKPYRTSWRQLMLAHSSGLGVTKRFVIIAPNMHFEELLPAEKAIAAVERIIADTVRDELAGVKVRTTGEVVLEHEEMQTISTGVGVASVASLILVCLTLWIAYRSFKLMFATFVSLTIGLIFSLGFATAAIGQLNLISIGFAVLFIGMGDAFSSHFCLRYRELLLRGQEQRAALRETLASTGSALILSAITAAIGLFSYIPTTYSGVAELGIIAGTSMFIALATTFTVLPALMKIMPYRPRTTARPRRSTPSLLSNWPLRYARPIRWITTILALAAAVLVFRVQVDFNPINLRDPNTESVKTFKYLLTSEDTSPMTLTSLASDEAEARAREARFQQLPTVDHVMSVFDLVPDHQDDKLAAISDLALILGPQFTHFPPPRSGGATLESVTKLQQAAKLRLSDGEGSAAAVLYGALSRFVAQVEAQPPETRQPILERLQASLLDPLPATISDLKESLSPNAIAQDSLPKELVERWVSPSGLYRLQIYPKKDLNDLDNLRAFILDAQQVDPNVTDLPVTYLESMNEVIKAFQIAFAIAFLTTAFILLLVLRNFKDTLLVLLPLLLASVFTAAATVLLDIPFNFANIIALPLLFGLGVDSGIHMAHRLHYLRSTDENLLSSSEAQGVFFGALTTVFSFLSLAFTSHRGTASMGLLLSIGLMLTLVCALVVLPAFSTLRLGRKAAT